ncbi:MAG: cobalamin biosynthesis protein [Methanobacteriaceae archaeon]|jgi:cobalt-precorrin 5A hydrolase|nr:cobalamin biosynthesis protein [Methanobacteriaceae archaeon]
MKVAIISLTEKGLKLSNKIKNYLDNDSTIIKTDIFYKDVKKNFKIAFFEYDMIIAIMASGIVIRSIAKLIDSKLKDPGILNLDENGEFVISLLSGHIGGANKFSKKIAGLLDTQEVITTSTDVNQKIAIDYLSNLFYLKILNPKSILYFNKAILNGEMIELFFNRNNKLDYIIDFIEKNTLETYLIKYDDKLSKNEILAKVNNHEIIIKERDLVVGIGCRKGKNHNEILKGLKIAINDLNLPIERINYIATGEMKKNEKGIIDISYNLNIPLKIVDIEKLKLFKSKDCSISKFVKSNFGINGVSEQSALIVAGFDSKLIYKKKAFDGVTIAIAISKN